MAGLTAKMDTSAFTTHRLSVQDACKMHETDLKKGLTDEEAKKRYDHHGPNELEKE